MEEGQEEGQVQDWQGDSNCIDFGNKEIGNSGERVKKEQFYVYKRQDSNDKQKG